MRGSCVCHLNTAFSGNLHSLPIAVPFGYYFGSFALGCICSCLLLLPSVPANALLTPLSTMSVTASEKTPLKTPFWIICCDATDATEQIASAITHWQLPGVRSRLGDWRSLSSAAAIAQAECAIFITTAQQPCPQVTTSPLSAVGSAARGPATLLASIQSCHGQTPQAWLLQLPATASYTEQTSATTESNIEPVVSQALAQIEIFVRHHYLQPLALQVQTAQNQQTGQAATSGQNNHVQPLPLAA